MASEIQVTSTLTYTNATYGITAKALSILGSQFNITGKEYAAGMIAVPTTAGGTAIPVGNLANLGWAMFKNADATNYIQLLSAVSGTVFAKLFPGEICLLRFNTTITAPAALANTLAAQLEYLILEI
jgi:hypothetical protein